MSTDNERIAELEAHLENINRELTCLTPGGSEFWQEPYTCIRFIKERLDSVGMSKLAALKAENAELEARLKLAEDATSRLAKCSWSRKNRDVVKFASEKDCTLFAHASIFALAWAAYRAAQETRNQ